jgi:putative Ca2+/H+ antiporter (TMEM165/GDT1 family)
MSWSHVPAYFFAGAFLANFFPHFVSGVLGRTFPTPFASPPFRGASSPRTNVLYGMCNLAAAYLLLVHVGDFEPRSAPHAVAVGLGLAAMALFITRSLARLQREGVIR